MSNYAYLIAGLTVGVLALSVPWIRRAAEPQIRQRLIAWWFVMAALAYIGMAALMTEGGFGEGSDGISNFFYWLVGLSSLVALAILTFLRRDLVTYYMGRLLAAIFLSVAGLTYLFAIDYFVGWRGLPLPTTLDGSVGRVPLSLLSPSWAVLIAIPLVGAALGPGARHLAGPSRPTDTVINERGARMALPSPIVQTIILAVISIFICAAISARSTATIFTAASGASWDPNASLVIVAVASTGLPLFFLFFAYLLGSGPRGLALTSGIGLIAYLWGSGFEPAAALGGQALGGFPILNGNGLTPLFFLVFAFLLAAAADVAETGLLSRGRGYGRLVFGTLFIAAALGMTGGTYAVYWTHAENYAPLHELVAWFNYLNYAAAALALLIWMGPKRHLAVRRALKVSLASA